jgi:branched chain amino acid efflux pump
VSVDPLTLLLILVLAVGSYGTRVAGHLILSRFACVDRRVEAALDAVPVAVITALVAPAVLATGVAETIAAAVTVAAATRFSIMPTLVLAAVTVALLRAAGL